MKSERWRQWASETWGPTRDEAICCEAVEEEAGRTERRYSDGGGWRMDCPRSWSNCWSTSKVFGTLPPRRFSMVEARSFSSSWG